MARSYAPGQRPLIIVGTGRCGSTFLHRLLALHEELGWLSTFNETFPRQQWLSVFSRLYAAPLPGRLKEMRAFPKPFEAYRFWESYLPGFSRRREPAGPGGDRRGEDRAGPRATRRILRFQGRDRLLVKVTGWARIAYFDRIYPDARFVFLQRDPRSVVSSWIKAGWLDVTSAPDTTSWQWGQVPEDYLAAWSDLGGGPAALDRAEDPARPRRHRRQLGPAAGPRPRAHLRGADHRAGADAAGDLPVRRASPGRRPSHGPSSETEFFDSTKTWQKHLTDAEGDRVLEFMRRTDRAAA